MPLTSPGKNGKTHAALKKVKVAGGRYILARNEDEEIKDAEARAAILALRMVSASELWARIPILVRGLRAATKKEVELRLDAGQVELDKAVAERLRRVDNRRMQLLRDAISTFCENPDEVEARSLLAFCMAIGSHFLAADHPGRSRDEVKVHASALLLSRSPGERAR